MIENILKYNKMLNLVIYLNFFLVQTTINLKNRTFDL